MRLFTISIQTRLHSTLHSNMITECALKNIPRTMHRSPPNTQYSREIYKIHINGLHCNERALAPTCHYWQKVPLNYNINDI